MYDEREKHEQPETRRTINLERADAQHCVHLQTTWEGHHLVIRKLTRPDVYELVIDGQSRNHATDIAAFGTWLDLGVVLGSHETFTIPRDHEWEIVR